MCYSYQALVSGVEWPADVNSSERETYLSGEEFQTVFGGLSWARYCALPAWKKVELKKRYHLF